MYFEPDGDIAAWAEDRLSGGIIEHDGDDAIQLLTSWIARVDAEQRANA